MEDPQYFHFVGAEACTITLDLVYSTTGNQCSAVDARVALIRFLVLCQAV